MRVKPVSTVHNAIGSNSEPLTSKEWLITNGIGGYASSTICGLNSRRYHGLLVAATHPPVGRVVMLSKLEETIVINGSRIDDGPVQAIGGLVVVLHLLRCPAAAAARHEQRRCHKRPPS